MTKPTFNPRQKHLLLQPILQLAPLLKRKLKIKTNTENYVLVGFYRKPDLWQLAQSDRKEITYREETLRKYKVDLKP